MMFKLAWFDQLRVGLPGGFARFRYAIAAIDQIALSIFGFGLNLCLVRALSETDYGTVSLWMTISLFAIAMANALVNSPMSTHLPAIADPDSRQRLTEAIATVNVVAIALTVVIVVALDLWGDAEWSPRDAAAAVSIPLFIAAGMYREYYRSIAFSRHDTAMLLWTDGPYLAVTTLCLVAMLVWPERFADLTVAFFAMSAGCIAARLCLMNRFALPSANPFRPGWFNVYRQILRDVSWTVVGVVTTHLHARSYVYVVVNMVGLAGLASINVVGVLFRPVRVLATAWGRTALPQMTVLLAERRIDAFDRIVIRALVLAAAGSAVWVLVLWLAWHPVERYFLNGRYPDAWSLLLPWAVASAFDGTNHVMANALRAAQDFKLLAYATIVSAPVSIAMTAAAITWHGYTWTMYGVAVGNFGLLLYMGYRLRRVRGLILAQA